MSADSFCPTLRRAQLSHISISTLYQAYLQSNIDHTLRAVRIDFFPKIKVSHNSTFPKQASIFRGKYHG